MATNLIEKLLSEAVQTGGTYAEFVVSEDTVAFICNGGKRRSTRKYRRSKAEIKEDEKILKTISEKNLLFSAQLRRIGFTLRNAKTAIFEKRNNDGFVSFNARKVNEIKEKQFEYICFTSQRDNCTGIAFATEQLKNGRRQIKPSSGLKMNGVNGSGISTDLKFIISCDLQVEGISATSDDQKSKAIIEELSEIFERALKEMMHLGLADMPLFSVLPNTLDDENNLNIAFLRTARKVCNSYPMFKNRSGSFVSRERVVYGADEVTKLFPQEIAKDLLGDKFWIKPCIAGSREERFLMDMYVPYYDRERFLNLIFSEGNPGILNGILQEQNDKWLRDFYVFCCIPTTDKGTKRQMIAGLKSIQSIRDQRGRMCYPYEVTYAANEKPLSNKSKIIKPEIIAPAGIDDEYSDQLRSFFQRDLGIKDYSQKPEIEDIASSMMTKKQPVDKAYVNKLLLLAKYDEEHPGEINFCSYNIFPCQSSKGIRRVGAACLVIGKPYIREGKLLASATGRYSLWGGFQEFLDDPDLKTILEFAKRCGAIGLPEIIRRPAEEHLDFQNSLYVPGEQGANDSSYDYIIPGLDEILKKRSLQLSKLVWDALLRYDHADDTLTAEYSADNRSAVNRCSSSLIIILRKRTWIPGKDGKMYMPENITKADISEEFVFDKSNPILKALNFGSGIEKRKKALKEMEKLAKKEGLRIISEQEYREFLEWKKLREG